MSSTLETVLDRRVIRRMAGARSYERGEDCFAGGRVRAVLEHDGTITAKVRGTREYRVKLWGEAEFSDFPARARWGSTGLSANAAWPLASRGSSKEKEARPIPRSPRNLP